MGGGKNILWGGATSLVAGGLALLYNRIAPETGEVIPAVTRRPPEGKLAALERVDIFKGNEVLNGELNSLVLARDRWSHLTKEELETHLSAPIRNRLKDIFRREGRDFGAMSGRIYYEMGDFSVEVLVLWREGPGSGDFTNYDRFEISLTR